MTKPRHLGAFAVVLGLLVTGCGRSPSPAPSLGVDAVAEGGSYALLGSGQGRGGKDDRGRGGRSDQGGRAGDGRSGGTRIERSDTPCGDLYPIALHEGTLQGKSAGAQLNDVYNGSQPGGFGWLTWDGANSEGALRTSLSGDGNAEIYRNPNHRNDRQVSVGDWVVSRPGVANSSGVRQALDELKRKDIVLPVYDRAQGSGANAQYRVVGFAIVRITDYRLPGQNRISATFRGWCESVVQDDPRGGGHGGGCQATPRPSSTPTPRPSATPTPTPVPTATPTPTPAPASPTPTPTPVPTATPTPTPPPASPSPTPPPSTAPATPTPTPVPSTAPATPTPTPISPTPTPTPVVTPTPTPQVSPSGFCNCD